jgi:amidase
MTDLWRRSASELATLIANKEVSASEVVDAHLERIEAVNSKVNAVVRVLADQARSAAAEADRKVASGEPLGPLHGVPFTVKENIDIVGLPTTWGVPALSKAVVPLDAPVVERVRAAGGIPIGRTNLPDMGLRMHTDSSLYGLTRNPWNLSRTAGGSSGGEAVAIATGMSPIGLGNDLGGSLRNPATACGIASIRPSAGRVPDAGFVPNQDRLLALQLMHVQGPMARRVADIRLGLQVLMGAHPRDPWSITAPLQGSTISKPIHVALVPEPPGEPTDVAVKDAVLRAAAALAEAGYEIDETCPPRYEEAISLWRQFLVGDLAAVLDQLLPLIGRDGKTFVMTVNGTVSPPDRAMMSQIFMKMDGVAREWSEFLARYPLVLTPTWTKLPFEHGFDVATSEGILATMELVRPVLPANLLGLPSACVPAGVDETTGLPIGVLLTGSRLREDLCLDAAEVIEKRYPLQTPIDPAG